MSALERVQEILGAELRWTAKAEALSRKAYRDLVEISRRATGGSGRLTRTLDRRASRTEARVSRRPAARTAARARARHGLPPRERSCTGSGRRHRSRRRP